MIDSIICISPLSTQSASATTSPCSISTRTSGFCRIGRLFTAIPSTFMPAVTPVSSGWRRSGPRLWRPPTMRMPLPFRSPPNLRPWPRSPGWDWRHGRDAGRTEARLGRESGLNQVLVGRNSHHYSASLSQAPGGALPSGQSPAIRRRFAAFTARRMSPAVRHGARVTASIALPASDGRTIERVPTQNTSTFASLAISPACR